MRYFHVTAENANGTENTLNFDRVPESSLKSLKAFFGENGVVLKPVYAYSIDDKPVYGIDEITGEYIPNTVDVI